MKKRVFVLFVLVVMVFGALCSACGGSELTVDVQTLYNAAVPKFVTGEVLPLDAATLQSLTGIKPEMTESFAACIPVSAVSGEMVFVVKAVDSASADTVAEKLENYRTQKLAEMNNYVPAEYDKINAASVKRNGNYVWIVVAADQAGAEAAITSLMK